MHCAVFPFAFVMTFLERRLVVSRGGWVPGDRVIFVNENENESGKNEKLTNSLTKTTTKTKKYCKTNTKLKLENNWQN